MLFGLNIWIPAFARMTKDDIKKGKNDAYDNC